MGGGPPPDFVMLSDLCEAFQTVPSVILAEDPALILPILDVRFGRQAKEVMGTPGAKPTPGQTAFWNTLCELWYGTESDEENASDEDEDALD